MKKTFVLSDQTVNQYGFIVLTAGINLERFKANPVMLYAHGDAGEKDVIGRWENVRIEGGKLMADPVFDLEDDLGKKIERKVANDFIKGASVWVDFKEDDIKLDYTGYEGIPVIVRSELMEGSIVPIPNNKNSLRLRAGKSFIEDETLAAKLSATQIKPEIENQTMKKVLLFASTLGVALAADATEDHVLEAVKASVTEKEALRVKNEELTTKLAAIEAEKVTELIEGAIQSKKLKAEQKADYTALAKANYASTKAIIDSLTPHTTISERLNAGNGGESAKGEFEGKTFGELQKLSGGGTYLLKLKTGNDTERAEYKRLWEAAFPGGKFNG